MLGDWWKQPFSADMSVVHWFLFVGLVLVIMATWQLILSHLVRGIEG